MNKPVAITTIGVKEDLFPMVENTWDFFSEKGNKTVFVSIGTSATPSVELQFSEMLGCPIHIFEPIEANIEKWKEVKEILTTRKVTETTSNFGKLASKKWVLSRNIHLQESLPFFFDGIINLYNQNCSTKKAFESIEQACQRMNLIQNNNHIDVLKIQLENHEQTVLQAVLEPGFRPALILIHWTALPDVDGRSMNAAANLQMMGYALIGKEGHNFLYYFNNNNYYETCSWEVINKIGENTLVNEIVKGVLPPITKNESPS